MKFIRAGIIGAFTFTVLASAGAIAIYAAVQKILEDNFG